MNIFLKELKSLRKSLIIWSIGSILMVVSGMGKYDVYASQGQSINEMLRGIPKSLRAVLGFSEVDVSTLSGYYSILFIYLLLMATIHAVMLGANIIAKEECDKTSEFLFVKPVSRNSIVTAKLLAALTNIIIFNLVTAGSLLIILSQYHTNGENVNEMVVSTMVGMLLLQLLFMVIGSALASVKKKPKTAASQASGVLLLTYLISVLIDLNENLEGLKYVTPFKYFEAKNVILGNGLEPIYMVLTSILIIGFTIVTYIFFKKRDLNV
ncbi:ABC transporter permease subunit [Bacillus tuaregi]|uniref:ABC transporter permease subunit n=1 Tax=Bacillus tuaregi TaxID=1816695 RepID=UPI0008F8D39B|nr:ABC transporter permease subunit [Bacillus tuaregi]